MSYVMSELSMAKLLELSVHEKNGDDLLARLGGLTRMSEATLDDITTLGVSKAAATKLMTIFEIARRVNSAPQVRTHITGPADVAALLRDLQSLSVEVFRVVCLNTKNFVLGVSQISVGTLDSSLAHPREVFKPAIARSAASIICVHNHPGSLGEVEPSPQDIALTKRLVDAGNVIGIPVIDHIIVGAGTSGRYCSLKELRQI